MSPSQSLSPSISHHERTSSLHDPVARGVVLTAFTLGGLVAGLIGERMSWAGLTWAGYGAALLSGGVPALIGGVAKLWRERRLDVDLLMVFAALGAISVGHADDGVILLFLFSLSNTLQDWAMQRTSSAIRALMKLHPSTATVRHANGQEERVSLEAVHVGDLLVVRPGERFAADAIVVEGSSSVDESALTGESVPVDKNAGDAVKSGTLNGEGVIVARAERLAGDSTLAKLIRLVEAAQAAKSPTERFADRLEGPYTVAVLLSAPVIYSVAHFGFGLEASAAWYRAMTFLVAASPCAVVISTPAAMLSAMAAGARHGVLFKNGAALEALSKVRVLAMDKTGTLTEGLMRLTALRGFESRLSSDDLHALAAGLERHSEHPVARAITGAHAGADVPVTDVSAIRGKGITGRLLREDDATRFGNAEVWAGTRALAADRGATLEPHVETELQTLETNGYTTMLLGSGRRVLAVLAVADTPRAAAKTAIAHLHRMGLRVAMLTGDRRVVAERVARELGVDEVRAELLPEHKLEVLADLKRDASVAMVGDGINDAPALAAADVGVAMGSGSDAALESADVVLMKNDLSRLAGAMRLARDAQGTVRFNLSLALSVIAVVGTISLFGLVPLPLAVIAHEGGTVLVCLIGVRLLAHPVTG
jgi:Zn2+/Cd2+-exporting ATPase